MQTTTCFSLERHAGPYETWPLRSRLLIDGEPTPTRIPGYALLHQFATPSGYVLVTDCECPFEEATSFVLLDRKSQLLSCRTLSIPYGSYNLDQIEWLDDRNARLSFWDHDNWLLTIRPRGIPFLCPRLRLGRIATPPGHNPAAPPPAQR
jgi:hypothetical protein